MVSILLHLLQFLLQVEHLLIQFCVVLLQQGQLVLLLIDFSGLVRCQKLQVFIPLPGLNILLGIFLDLILESENLIIPQFDFLLACSNLCLVNLFYRLQVFYLQSHRHYLRGQRVALESEIDVLLHGMIEQLLLL